MNIQIFKFSFLQSITCLLLLSVALPAAAADLSIRPFLFNETLEPRSIESKKITLTNDSDRTLTLYATVNEITVGTDGEIKEFFSAVETSREDNITSWIELTRGRITLPPRESTEVDITFKIHPFAVPGEYHAFIGFFHTNKRYVAEEAALNGDAPGIPLTITISDTAVVGISITEFSIPRFLSVSASNESRVTIDNTGETDETISGEVILYDKKGAEIDSYVVGGPEVIVRAGEKIVLKNTLPEGLPVGRYKANLNISYGEGSTAFDTTQFFVAPIYFMLMLLLGIFVITLSIVLLLRRAYSEHTGSEEAEVDLPVYANEGYFSKDKEHDLKINQD